MDILKNNWDLQLQYVFFCSTLLVIQMLLYKKKHIQYLPPQKKKKSYQL